MLSIAIALLSSILTVAAGLSTRAQTAFVSVLQPDVDFGKVVRGAVLEHTFTVVNDGDSPLKIDKVRLTPPLFPSDIPSRIPAHEQATLRIKLDTKALDGPYEGVVMVAFSDPKVAETQLTVTGRVVLPIEVPPAIFVSAERGEKKQASISIVNHEPEPVRIDVLPHSSERFTIGLATVEQGRRFRLTLAMKPDGPAGKNVETIVLMTNSVAVPELKIAAYTYLREPVYTFPDAVDFGAIRFEEFRRNPELSQATAQTLMIYRKGTSDFQANISTDVPGLSVRSERGPTGDRYQATIVLLPDQIRPGPIRGSIIVDTNDPRFPRLTVPVSGQLLPH